MYWMKYIEKVDHEIEELVEKEAKGLTPQGEKSLHLLFENCKHAREYMEYKKAHGTNPAMGTHTKADNPY